MELRVENEASDIILHLRNNCRQIVTQQLQKLRVFFSFYSIMRLKENSLPDS